MDNCLWSIDFVVGIQLFYKVLLKYSWFDDVGGF